MPAGAPFAAVTGPWEGRYLVGLGGTISGFAITADGDWTLTIEQRSSAMSFDAASGVDGENADVIAYDDAAAWGATVSSTAGPDRHPCGDGVGSAGVGQPGRLVLGDIEVPAGRASSPSRPRTMVVAVTSPGDDVDDVDDLDDVDHLDDLGRRVGQDRRPASS